MRLRLQPRAANDATAAANRRNRCCTTAATDATAAATSMASDAMAALDPANFDAVKVKALIDASALDDALKTTLKTGVDAAATDAAKVPEALAAVKTALGM